MLIGCGYHARRIYVPHLMQLQDVKLDVVVDLSSQKEVVESFFKEKSINGTCFYYTNNTEISDDLTSEDVSNLNNLVREHKIEAVIISTEPLAHFKYAKWALDQHLHILMDKPITTEYDVSVDNRKARKIYSDYVRLKNLYTDSLKIKNTAFILQAQRRHHGGFRKTRDLIIEISRKTNCPVTSVQAFHSDGQWRFPKEIIEQTYHPYNQGYGKMSHSGYHSLDAAVWFAESSIMTKEKEYDSFEVYAQAVRPSDFFSQITPDDYMKLFPTISRDELLSSDELMTMLKKREIGSVTGELDMHAIIALRHGEETITNIASHAIHNGFSQRNWLSVKGRDLYKGNGRVRHESYVIEQGPFQCIIVNSFQSHEIFKSDIKPSDVGGEYHYDIHVFRNSTLFPEFKSYELITMIDINKIANFEYSRGHQEDARRNCVEEFISAIRESIPANEQNSNLLEHDLSTQLLGAIYQSVSSREGGGVVKDKICRVRDN